MMKALVYDKLTDNFEIKQIPVPEPKNDEIRVKVLACALNPVDAKVGMWKGSINATVEHFVLGLDVCGRVDAIGSDVGNIPVGSLVLFHGKMLDGVGGFAEYSVNDALTTVVLPSSVDGDDKDLINRLAASPCAAWTAYKGMQDLMGIEIGANYKEGIPSVYNDSTFAITGASGGVGSFALQFAKQTGFKNIVAICSGKHEEHVRRLGADTHIDYQKEKIDDGLRRVAADGVDYVIDCVGAETTKLVIDSMNHGGKILPIVSFADFGDMRCFMKSITIAQVALGGSHKGGLKARNRLRAIGEAVTAMILEGDLEVPVTSVIPLESTADALKEMLKANTIGKIVMSLM